MASVTLQALPHVLYRAFDPDDDLLYIGISMCPDRRWAQHAADKPWFRDVARVAFEHHPDRASVLAAEREAIATEKPKHNTVHNGISTTNRQLPLIAPNRPEFPLVGKSFHSWMTKSCGCDLIVWQGQIIGQVNESIYMVQLYDWIMGMPSDQKMVDLDVMIDWTFYGDREEMKDHYNCDYSPRRRMHERNCLGWPDLGK